MSFKACWVEAVYFVRWVAPQAADHAQLMREVERVAKAKGRLRAIVTIVPHDLPVPDAQVRRESAEWTRRLMEWAEVAIVVIEGRGFKYTIMRGFAAAMATVAGTRDRSFSEASVEAALARLRPPLAMPTAQVLEKLRHAGLLEL